MMQKNYFSMGFWNYVNVGVLDETAVQDWTDLGMNLAMSFEYNHKENRPEQMLAVLDECERRNLKVIVCDRRCYFTTLAEVGEEAYTAGFAQAVKEFGSHPAVMSFHVGDEPGEFMLPHAKRACQIHRELAPHLTPFLNFLPFWIAPNFKDTLGVDNAGYEELLTEFVKEAGLEIVCYDCYSGATWRNRQMEISNYFFNLNLFRRVAEATGATLWTSLLSVGHWGFRCPTEDDLRWQIATSVAHGVTGILWFFVYERSLDSSFRVPPIDLFWERTETFEWLSRQNRSFMSYYAEKFSALRLVKVYHHLLQYGGTEPFIFGKDEVIDYVTSSYDQPLIVSRFENQETGRPTIVVVNNSQTEPTNVKVKLKAPYEYGDRGGDWLAPGQMMLIEL